MIKEQLTSLVRAAVAEVADELGVDIAVDERVHLSPPKQAAHGDFACNAAMVLAKPAGRAPRDVAALIQERLGQGGGLISKTDIAGPGFLNLFVDNRQWREALVRILDQGADFLRSEGGRGQVINLEYVSANPTGPLHIAHGRGAVTGDIVGRLLRFAGYEVRREYYVNDLGNQVDIMARSIFLRYGELFGRAFEQPEDFYPGEYISELAQEMKQSFGDTYLDADEATWMPVFRKEGVDRMLGRIKTDLAAFGVEFDSFVSERALTKSVDLDAFLGDLRDKGHIYEEDGKQWFKTTAFGDEKDRVVVRDDGRSTYFASDIAYHHDKMQRGAQHLINVWGADHGGYIQRVAAGLEALGHGGDVLEVILIQMVSLSREGEAVRMGKRLGNAIWLSDVVREAGADATRYFFAMRKVEAQMEFDIALATQKSLDNPVYYAQMGHARLAAIGRKAASEGAVRPAPSVEALEPLALPEELDLVKRMVRAPEVVANAAAERAPHMVVHYIQDLIAAFHSYYSKYKGSERVVSDDAAKTGARLLLCAALQETLRCLLSDILGVSAPEEMYLEEASGD